MKQNYFLFLGIMLLSLTTLSAQNAKVKFGKGLSITAPDSSMHLKASFRMQTLFDAKRSLDSGSDWNSKFLIRRSRLKFDGWVVNPNLVYKVELALSNNDLKSSSDFSQSGGAPKIILDAAVKWKFHRNFSLWVGQTKLPGNRERVVSSQKLQLVDRSLVNSIFNIDRDLGIHLRGKFKVGNAVIKPIVSIDKGEGRNIIAENIGGLSYTGRLEYLPLGEFASKGDYFEADLKREPTPKLAFGGSINLNKGDARQKRTGVFLVDENGDYLTNDLQTILLDVMFKYKGFSAFAEYADKRCVLDDGVRHEDVVEQMIDANGRSYHTGTGFMMQAGYLLKSNWEFAARYTTVTPDWEHSFTGIKEYTFGINKYIVGHSLKVQSDVSLVDKADKETNELRYRLQFELAF